MTKKNTITTAAFILAIAMTSCQYKDFDGEESADDNHNTEFVYDYSAIDFKPEMMRLVVYPLDGQFTEPMVRDFRDSLATTIDPGRYRCVAFNDDSEVLRYTGYDDMDANVRISSAVSDPVKTTPLDTLTGATIYDYPDRVATCHISTFTIVPDDLNVIRLKPVEATRNVEVIVEGMKNMGLLNSALVCLDGCYVEYFPMGETTGTSTGIVSSPDVNISPDDKLLTSNFSFFGLNSATHHTLRVIIIGKAIRHVLNFDVTDKIEYTSQRGDIRIHVKTDFDVQTLAPSSNFDVNVDDWNNDSTDISL